MAANEQTLGIVLVSHLITKHSIQPIFQEKSAIELTIQAIHETFPNAKIIHIGSPEQSHIDKEMGNIFASIKKQYPAIKIKEAEPSIYETLLLASKSLSSCENIIWLHTHQPLFLPNHCLEALEQHSTHLAEYSYFENFPSGIGCELLSQFALNKLTHIASGNNEPYHQASINRIINFDINAYDIEIILSPEDRRKDRLHLMCDSKRNTEIVQALLNHINLPIQELSVEQIYKTLDDVPAIRRPKPSFIELELVSGTKYPSNILPSSVSKQKNGYMDKQLAIGLADALSSWCDTCTICFTGMTGEPTEHPDFIEIITHYLKQPGLDILIESNGMTFTSEISNALNALPDTSRLKVIFFMDAANKETYQAIHGFDGLEMVEQHVVHHLKKHPRTSYLQFTHIKENEQQVEAFRKRWQDYEKQIIVQKYNDYGGLLEKKSVLDLSPIKRFPCWHLDHDLFISLDGKVLMCKQDIAHQATVGTLGLSKSDAPEMDLETQLETLWQANSSVYLKHHTWWGMLNNPQQIDPNDDLPELCKRCDEWYTFNA